MCTRRVSSLTVVGALVAIAAAVPIWAQQPSLSASPDHILKGTAPTITLTLDKSVKEIKDVKVAGIEVAVPQPSADGKVTVQLPNLDLVGLVDVAVIGKDGNPLAVGQLTYVKSEEPPSVPSSTGLALLLLFVVLIVLLPIWATIYDIRKSYEERHKVFADLQRNTTAGDTAALLKQMDQGPTGFMGLTRGLIALTLILVLAFAVFYLVVFAPPTIPSVAERLLTLLAGTLTAITGFYFGSRTATEAAAAATASQKPPTGDQIKNSGAPTISDVAQDDRELTVTGNGFGDERKEQSSLKIDDKEIATKNWNDTEINATLPGNVQGDVSIVVTNEKGTPSEQKRFTVAAKKSH